MTSIANLVEGPLRTGAGLAVIVLLLAAPAAASAQESDAASGGQDAETRALDSTATQWQFQFAYQTMPSYYADTLDSGQMRAPGLDNYLQLRIVAPLPMKGFTILPRLTLRHYEDLRNKKSGFGNTELFALIVPKAWDWGSGRAGLGPLVTLPGDKNVARNEWGYGVAGAVVNSSGKWFYGVLLTQSWRAVDPQTLPTGTSDTNPLGIAPFLNYRIGNGWYVGNGDMVAQYDWDSNKLFLPIGVRVGKVNVTDKGSTWNMYVEYQTSAVYKSYPGPAVQNSIRFNVTYAIPVF